jgi:deoxyribodipyrimidine photo-lyase
MADYGKSIFLFRRDLRISDNTGLIEASQASKTVVSLFIFDPRQGARNPYFSPNAFQFMIESLEDLAHQVTRHVADYPFFVDAQRRLRIAFSLRRISRLFS